MIEITLYCIGYFIIWCLSAIFISRTSWDDEMAIIGGFFWPIMLPITFVMWCVEKFGGKHDLY